MESDGIVPKPAGRRGGGLGSRICDQFRSSWCPLRERCVPVECVCVVTHMPGQLKTSLLGGTVGSHASVCIYVCIFHKKKKYTWPSSLEPVSHMSSYHPL